MTKTIRIENADTSNYRLVVELWDKGQDGGPDVLVSTHPLDYPTSLFQNYLTATRYAVVREVAAA